MSLKAISEATGASVSTISRVLNNPSYQCQNPDMTEKIREAARSLGYVPNQNARQLKLGRYVVDILLARFDTLDKDPFFSEVFRIAETEFYNKIVLSAKY